MAVFVSAIFSYVNYNISDMTRQQLLLTLLMEECNEVAQRASKAIRFTPEEIQEGQGLTNAERIVYEFNDLLAVIGMLENEGVLPKETIRTDLIQAKQEKIEKYLKYSESLGVI